MADKDSHECFPAKIQPSLSMSFSHSVCCPLFDITVSQCDIELATLEFHDATVVILC